MLDYNLNLPLCQGATSPHPGGSGLVCSYYTALVLTIHRPGGRFPIGHMADLAALCHDHFDHWPAGCHPRSGLSPTPSRAGNPLGARNQYVL